jgi:hypothetical protein
MTKITEEDMKEHLDNLINAIYALSPTRNYVLQFLELLPRDYPKMMDAYPNLFKDEEVRDRLKDVFGITISEDVEVGHGLGRKLNGLSNDIRSTFFDTYEWEEFQKNLSEYLDRDLPNVIDELWEQRIMMAMSEPTYGKDCANILKTMKKEGEGDQRSTDISVVMEETGLDRSTLLRIKAFLTKDIGILDPASESFILARDLSKRETLIEKYFGE